MPGYRWLVTSHRSSLPNPCHPHNLCMLLLAQLYIYRCHQHSLSQHQLCLGLCVCRRWNLLLASLKCWHSEIHVNCCLHSV